MLKDDFLIILSFLMLSIQVPVQAQIAPNTDSLSAVLKQSVGVKRVQILQKLSEQFKRSNADTALYFARQAIDLSRQIENESLQAESHRRLGRLLSQNGRNPEGLPHLMEAKNRYELMGNLHQEATALGNIGSLYMRQSDYKQALEYYFSSLNLWQKLEDQQGLAGAYYNIALINERMGRREQAVEFYSKALEIHQHQDNYSGIAINATSLGSVYADMGETDAALNVVKKGLAAAEKLPGAHAKATILLEMSSLYQNSQSYAQAIAANTEALGLARSMPDKLLESLALRNIAEVHRAQNQFSRANTYLLQMIPLLESTEMQEQLVQTFNMIAQNQLDLKNWEDAAFYALRAFNLAEKLRAFEQGLKSMQILTTAYEEQEMYRQAVSAQKKVSAIKDSLYKQEHSRQIAEMEMRYQTEQKEQEINQLHTRQEKAQLTRNALAAGLALILVIGLLIYNRQRLKINKNRTELENNRLKEQKLKQDLEFKNKQLTTHSLNLVQKNEVMKELKESIYEIKLQQNGKIQKKLTNLQHLVDYSFNLDEDWEEFRLYFEEVHTGFFETLKQQYPNLTPNELRLSALVKLNLTIKEIATILGISPDSVKTARYRLRKKLGMETEENLTEFMMNVEKASSK